MRAQLEHAIATLIGESASTFVLPANATQLAPAGHSRRRSLATAGTGGRDVAAAERLVAASNGGRGARPPPRSFPI